ncbi:MAG: hypothetical protein ACYCW6_19325 [Candidatus Xenobia bacterium]
MLWDRNVIGGFVVTLLLVVIVPLSDVSLYALLWGQIGLAMAAAIHARVTTETRRLPTLLALLLLMGLALQLATLHWLVLEPLQTVRHHAPMWPLELGLTTVLWMTYKEAWQSGVQRYEADRCNDGLDGCLQLISGHPTLFAVCYPAAGVAMIALLLMHGASLPAALMPPLRLLSHLALLNSLPVFFSLAAIGRGPVLLTSESPPQFTVEVGPRLYAYLAPRLPELESVRVRENPLMRPGLYAIHQGLVQVAAGEASPGLRLALAPPAILERLPGLPTRPALWGLAGRWILSDVEPGPGCVLLDATEIILSHLAHLLDGKHSQPV